MIIATEEQFEISFNRMQEPNRAAFTGPMQLHANRVPSNLEIANKGVKKLAIKTAQGVLFVLLIDLQCV